jgi:hypothetical protein
MGISAMKPMPHSLYSFQDELRQILGASPTEAQDKQRVFEENNKVQSFCTIVFCEFFL